jgi:hypothetical protein
MRRIMRHTARWIKNAMLVRAAESVSRQCPNLFTFADGREVHAAPNKARHFCERPRDGARAVS